MIKDNPFAGVGSVIRGRRFIGRENELRQIREKLLGQEDFSSLAFTGMPRIGKSSLADHALVHNRNAELTLRKIVVAYMDVSKFTASNQFFDGLVRRIEASLEDCHLGNQSLTSQAQKTLSTEAEDGKFFEVERFFRGLTKAKIRAIFILDEFDSIRTVFHGKNHCFTFLRELASGGDCKAGFIILSKRHLSDISKMAGIDPQYWKNVLTERFVCGFDDDAVDLYFDRLKEAGIQCAPDVQSEVLAHCGMHPFLLDSFAFEAFGLVRGGGRLEKKHCAAILAPALVELCRLVKEVLEDTPLLNKLVQILVGPQINVTAEDINTLIKYGLLIPGDKGRLRPFVPAFTDFLRRELVSSVAAGLSTSRSNPKKLTNEGLPKVIVHKNDRVIEVNGVRLKKLSVSQYALIRTMAEKFTLNNPETVKQREVLEHTAALLRTLVVNKPDWFNDAERKAWSKRADTTDSDKGGDNRQLWNEVMGKLRSSADAQPLFSIFPIRETTGGYKLQIKSSQIRFKV